MKKFTCDELKEKLLLFAQKNGIENIPLKLIEESKDMPSGATFKRYFGTWAKALDSVNLGCGIITGRPQDEAVVLSERSLDIIEGELLGDGTIECAPTRNACFAHSTANPYYTNFLYKSLINSGLELKKIEFLPARNNASAQTRIRTSTNQTFRKLRDKWYVGSTKIIPNGFELNRIKCLHWYLGDGYFEHGTCKFSTCGFTFDEVERLAIMLTDLGFKSALNKRSGGYYIIRMSKNVVDKFLNWLGPCPVKNYEHRWGLRSKNEVDE